ncbi:type VI secretion system contractile sheath domain-containing protein [Rhizobium halophytocola]
MREATAAAEQLAAEQAAEAEEAAAALAAMRQAADEAAASAEQPVETNAAHTDNDDVQAILGALRDRPAAPTDGKVDGRENVLARMRKATAAAEQLAAEQAIAAAEAAEGLAAERLAAAEAAAAAALLAQDASQNMADSQPRAPDDEDDLPAAEDAQTEDGSTSDDDTDLDALLGGADDDLDALLDDIGGDDLEADMADDAELADGDAADEDARPSSEEDDSTSDDTDLDALLGESDDDLDALLDEIGGDDLEDSDAGDVEFSDGDEADEDARPSSEEGDSTSEEDDTDLEALLGEADEDLDALLDEIGGDDLDDSDAGDVELADGDTADEDAPPSSEEDDSTPEADDTDLDALLAGSGDDLDALLDEIGGDDLEADMADDADTDDAATVDLDSLSAEDDAPLEDDSAEQPGDDSDSVDLDGLLADDDASVRLDGDESGLSDADEPAAEPEQPITTPFGTLATPRPDDRDQPRAKFRIALLGDFSGRASRGLLEIGDGLANRKAMKFDVDTIDAIIARFATTLVLPIGEDGAGVEVKLDELDDLHPDALYENVAIFDELSVLRQRVARGDAAAIAKMQAWAGEHTHVAVASQKRSKGNTVPADRKLSEFHTLIGDMQGRLARPSPAAALIGRLVGPYVQAAPDPAQATMLAAIDEALSGAMRTILHHPDFQAVESTWRSLEFLARRIETGAGLEIVLYDVSAEEWATDLSAQDELSESGLFRMLAEEPRLDAAQGPLSAVFALYTLEETPPHAELLARMAKISAWMNAPFLAAISPQFLETKKQDRHPLVVKAWDALRALPEAAYVGLAAPRFLLRLPYGEKTEPADAFDFEEFSLRSGLKGMVWANPVILSATLMAATVTRMGKKMRLGEVMTLDDIPVHTMIDPHGDQVALPCTERLLNTRTMAEVVARGFMPVLSIKGRSEVRQGSFQALGAGLLAGPWPQASGQGAAGGNTEVAIGGAPAPAGRKADSAAASDASAGDDDDLDLSALGLDDDTSSSDDDGSLDDLLSQFDDDAGDGSGDDEELDPELAALLEGL